MPIGVVILIKLINKVEPIPNYILTLPCVEVFRCILVNF